MDMEKCPRCGCEKNVTGIQTNQGCICADTRLLLNRQALYHVLCLECGTVIRSFVKYPERLIVKKKQEAAP